MQVDYTVHIWKEGPQYVAHAVPLDVASSGDTPEQARAALDEAVPLFLETAREMGTLAQVLEECAYEWHGGAWHPPEWVALERHSALLTA